MTVLQLLGFRMFRTIFNLVAYYNDATDTNIPFLHQEKSEPFITKNNFRLTQFETDLIDNRYMEKYKLLRAVNSNNSRQGR